MVFRQICNKERANSENDDQFTRIRPSQLREFEVFLNFIVECEIYVFVYIHILSADQKMLISKSTASYSEFAVKFYRNNFMQLVNDLYECLKKIKRL